MDSVNKGAVIGGVGDNSGSPQAQAPAYAPASVPAHTRQPSVGRRLHPVSEHTDEHTDSVAEATAKAGAGGRAPARAVSSSRKQQKRQQQQPQRVRPAASRREADTVADEVQLDSGAEDSVHDIDTAIDGIEDEVDYGYGHDDNDDGNDGDDGDDGDADGERERYASCDESLEEEVPNDHEL